MSYETDIIKALAKMGKTNGTTNPDSKHNTGALLGEAFMWGRMRRTPRIEPRPHGRLGERGSDP